VIARNHLPVSGTAGVTDMRKGFAALAAQTGQTTAQNPFSHCPLSRMLTCIARQWAGECQAIAERGTSIRIPGAAG